jgi:hypothetical protein
MTYHHSIHEGMDWGAVGLQKNDPREPAEMTVTKWKSPTKQNTEMNTPNTTSKASKLVSDQNTRRQTLDRVGSFGEEYPVRTPSLIILRRQDAVLSILFPSALQFLFERRCCLGVLAAPQEMNFSQRFDFQEMRIDRPDLVV